jgi:LysR family transcriptional regulator, transcription activator of glutamate synthase operon
MELRQLRYLVALAEERHFTRAAAREHVAQPALSQQISRLEREVGLALVERTTRSVALTDAGERLVERARQALAAVDAGRAELQALAGVREGRVTIGAIQALGPLDLPLLLAAYHERYPGVELAVREEPSGTLASMVQRGSLDLAFLSLGEQVDQRSLAFCPLATEELVALVPASHRLAGRKRLRLVELRDEQFIGYREGATIRQVLLAAADTVGFQPRFAFESNEVARIRALVARGLAVAVLPRSEAQPSGDPIAVLELQAPTLRRDVTLAWHAARAHSPAAAAFLDLAQQAEAHGAVAPGQFP